MTAAPIRAVDAAEAEAHLGALADILEDAVDDGASIGFVPPLGPTEACDYWRSVVEAVREGSRVLLVAYGPDGALVGSAQLGLEGRANGRHRAEVMKVMVHRRARRRGIGRSLLLAAEEHAHRLGRSTLVLDTRLRDHAHLVTNVLVPPGDQRVVVRMWVSRTWRLGDSGSSDARDVGVAVADWTSVDPPR